MRSFQNERGRISLTDARHLLITCRRDWRVPHDVAIICGQNDVFRCEHPRPSLSSVEVGFERIGYEPARMLDRLMKQKPSKKKKKKKKKNNNNNNKKSPPEHILLPPTGLVVRESTDFFAVDDPRISAALAFIAANSHRQINAHDVAHASGIGVRLMQREFADYVGHPIATEIQRVRIERARRELAEGKRRIHEIARDVGFGRAMRMCQVFRRELGVTPREYRKQRQKEDGR